MESLSLRCAFSAPAAAPACRSRRSRSAAVRPACAQRRGEDDAVPSSSAHLAPALGRREALSASAAAVATLYAGSAGAVGFEKKMVKRKIEESEYTTAEAFPWRGDQHEGLKYYDLVVGKGQPVSESAVLTVHFDCKYRGIVAVSSREGRLLGGNRTLAEPFQFKYGKVPDEFTRPRKRKTVNGVGIEVRQGERETADQGLLVVVDTTKDAPAAKGGLRPLDRIIAIDGAPTSDMTSADVGRRLVGDIGTTVEFTVRKGSAAGEEQVVKLTREAVPVKVKAVAAYDGPSGGLFTGTSGPKPPPALWLAVAGMREGGRRSVIVPADVGYEDVGSNEIPPNATFQLDIEVITVKPPAAA